MTLGRPLSLPGLGFFVCAAGIPKRSDPALPLTGPVALEKSLISLSLGFPGKLLWDVNETGLMKQAPAHHWPPRVLTIFIVIFGLLHMITHPCVQSLCGSSSDPVTHPFTDEETEAQRGDFFKSLRLLIALNFVS